MGPPDQETELNSREAARAADEYDAAVHRLEDGIPVGQLELSPELGESDGADPSNDSDPSRPPSPLKTKVFYLSWAVETKI